MSTGGHLVSIHSEEENTFISSTSFADDKNADCLQLTWIGLKKPNYPANATWAWTDGSALDYLNWAPGKPEDITENFMYVVYVPSIAQLFIADVF
ncbi:unnamed protein product [Strongylus vulgaris]|uniref:C-type lectin domain-containing protein n=1 Tax=Strongylus vulgaris TaxID=40348 RepID=A0A3P7M1Q4_STRVU|nr:unnamed protein product [Strongylus vulgaris]